MAQIGWTKLALIADLVEPGAELDAIAIAEDNCTAKELPDRLAGGSPRTKTKTVVLRFTKAQYGFFSDVLMQHGARRPRRGHGLMRKEQTVLKALGYRSKS